MNKTFKTALTAALVLGAGQAAHADLTINGAVGLPLNPTAQIPQVNGVRVQGNYYDLGGEDLDANIYGVYAAGRVSDQIEINGGIAKSSNDQDDIFDALDRTGFAIGAKYLFTRESDPVGVRIAAGAGYDRTLANNFHAYVVGTKYLGEVTGERVPVTGHLGLRYDRYNFDLDIPGVDDDSSKVSIFAGVEVPLSRTGAFSVVGEVGSKNTEEGKSPYSASFRYRPPGQGLSASVGIQRQGITEDNGLFVQLGYSFSTGQ